MVGAQTVANVFKIVICSILLMCVCATSVNLYIVFATNSKVNAVGQSMQTELSRNNSILYSSMTEFAKELEAIDNKSKGVYRLSKIEFVNDSTATPTSVILYENTAAKDSETSTLQALFTDEASYLSSGCMGNYGEFRTIRLTYELNFEIFAWGNGGTVAVKPIALKSNYVVDFKTPCLRYMK